MSEPIVLGISGLVLVTIAGLRFFVLIKSIVDERRSARVSDERMERKLDAISKQLEEIQERQGTRARE